MSLRISKIFAEKPFALEIDVRYPFLIQAREIFRLYRLSNPERLSVAPPRFPASPPQYRSLISGLGQKNKESRLWIVFLQPLLGRCILDGESFFISPRISVCRWYSTITAPGYKAAMNSSNSTCFTDAIIFANNFVFV